jgi:hypothetical protein
MVTGALGTSNLKNVTLHRTLTRSGDDNGDYSFAVLSAYGDGHPGISRAKRHQGIPGIVQDVMRACPYSF